VTTVTEKLEAAMHRLYASARSPEMRHISSSNIIIGPVRDTPWPSSFVKSISGHEGQRWRRRAGRDA